jgi:hypothetical protein
VTGSEQADIIWRKSTASATGSCVEVAVAHDSVLIRNSRDPLGVVLSFTRREWASFLEGLNYGKFPLNQTGTTPSDTLTLE